MEHDLVREQLKVMIQVIRELVPNFANTNPISATYLLEQAKIAEEILKETE